MANEEAQEGPGSAATNVRVLRPGQCKAFMRRKLAAEFPGIVEGFVKAAKTGSCPHVKLASELLERKRAVKRVSKGKSSAGKLLEELRAL